MPPLFGPAKELANSAYGQLNWFRIHLLSFTFIPLLFSGFFMAANPSSSSGEFVTTYIDALFMCFSAMTTCGLSTVSVSALQPAQQAFLLLLMLFGDMASRLLIPWGLADGAKSVVNLITVLARQRWFRTRGYSIVKSDILRRMHRDRVNKDEERQSDEPGIVERRSEPKRDGSKDQGEGHRIDGGRATSSSSDGEEATLPGRGDPSSSSSEKANGSNNPWEEGFRRRHQMRSQSRTSPQTDKNREKGQYRGIDRRLDNRQPDDPHGRVPHASSGRTAHTGRGGFPSVHIAVYQILARLFPRALDGINSLLWRQVEDETLHHSHHSHPMHNLSDAVKAPIVEHKDKAERREAQRVKWLPPGVRGVVVGRNSQFFEEELSEEDLELLGSLEYKATNVLTVLLVVLFWILIPFAIVSIYFAKVDTWDNVFLANGGSQSGTVGTTWFSFFQVVSAFSSCGLSLVDLLMVPFQNCYLLIYVLVFPMMAGNQALPLFLRAEVWLLSKVVTPGSELEVSLHFIMTHSRRLFLYLLPSYQSYWLLGVEGLLWVISIVGFVAYNHGLPYYNQLGTAWEKFTLGLFEGLAARASGFAIVSLPDLAPAMNFLYLILIFTCNYPIVMSIRSTNVYEERALGIHGEHAPGQGLPQATAKDELFSKYLKHHLLPQIYFDLWPIAVGTMLILVVERGKVLATENSSWINDWRVLFEATSAYGTVGLSYDNPFNTSSLCGTFRKLSKLVLILLMLRGRHRGLPLAIDRAIMFPLEYLRDSTTGESQGEVQAERVRRAGEEADSE